MEWKKNVVNMFPLALDCFFVPSWQNELCDMLFYEFVLSYVLLCCDDLGYLYYQIIISAMALKKPMSLQCSVDIARKQIEGILKDVYCKLPAFNYI